MTSLEKMHLHGQKAKYQILIEFPLQMLPLLEMYYSDQNWAMQILTLHSPKTLPGPAPYYSASYAATRRTA